ncbi:MAG: ABC transporter ATP-binding protein [Candidatus Eisenbacteria bacterium]|nr:ABC transporter ATP-binding protein [Candidatus Eisenbacteria bacterium]MCC7140971.1 ABC transporter ATP-binding protein [Candidatus Eisenbacteria bacterium]
MIALEVSNLVHRYTGGHESLRGISFQVEEGECVGLIGPNGAGKSTLLLHLNGILPERESQHSSIRVLDREVTTQNLAWIRRNVGLLFQDPDDQLFCPTVFDDVAFGPEQTGLTGKELAACVAGALAQVGLTGYEERLPHRLSQGEKRRVCLAGVLACDPRLLVLDEPTSNLDPRARRELRDLLRRLPATKLIATHDLEFVVELCPRVLVFDQGRIVAAGPTRTVLADAPLMLAHGLEVPHILQHDHPHGAARSGPEPRP